MKAPRKKIYICLQNGASMYYLLIYLFTLPITAPTRMANDSYFQRMLAIAQWLESLTTYLNVFCSNPTEVKCF